MAIRDHFLEKNSVAAAKTEATQAGTSDLAPGTILHVVEASRELEANDDQHAVVSTGQDLSELAVADDSAKTAQQGAQEATQEVAAVAGLNQVDAWALRFLTVSRSQPLIEAIDNDFSNYVTVAELNSFTSARPAGWR